MLFLSVYLRLSTLEGQDIKGISLSVEMDTPATSPSASQIKTLSLSCQKSGIHEEQAILHPYLREPHSQSRAQHELPTAQTHHDAQILGCRNDT